MKSLFLCHGGPTIVEERNSYTDFLREFGKKQRPDGIIIFTAHWESSVTAISRVNGIYDTIHDFYGFPEHFYEKKYNAKGSVELADKVGELFENEGLEYKYDETRGLDHGSWDILSIMYPEADIPVVQISVNPFFDKEVQFAIGEALKGLKDDNIMIIGSGSTVHNLATVDWNADRPEEWAVEFDNWLIKAVEDNNKDVMKKYQELAPYGKKAVPREEHLVPLFIAMGAAGQERPQLLHQSYVYGTLSYIAIEF